MLLPPAAHPGHLTCFHNVSTSSSFREHRSSKVSMPWFSTIALSYLWKNSSIPSKVFGKSLYGEIIQGILALVLHHSIKGLWPISPIGEIIQGIHALVLQHTIKGLWPISLIGEIIQGIHALVLHHCLGSACTAPKVLKTALMLACIISFLSFFTWAFFLFL